MRSLNQATCKIIIGYRASPLFLLLQP